MKNLKRFLVILISFLICYILQTVILTRIPYFTIAPNLMLAEVISVGFLYGKGYGLGTGTAAGLLLDILGSGTPGFYTLILSVLGYLNGILSEKMESEILLVLFLLVTVNEAVFNAYVFLFSFLIGTHYVFMTYASEIFIPELLLTLVSFIIIYGMLIFFSKRWDLRVNKGEVRVV